MSHAFSAELAACLEEAALDDGCHLGATDALHAAMALRLHAGAPAHRKKRQQTIGALAALLVVAMLNPAALGMLDLNRDGVIDADDLRYLADRISPPRMTALDDDLEARIRAHAFGVMLQ